MLNINSRNVIWRIWKNVIALLNTNQICWAHKTEAMLKNLSFQDTSLSRYVAACTALVCGAQCSMPVKLGHWQSQTSNVCSEMTGQWSDRSAMSSHKIVTTRSNKLLAWLGIEDLDLILKERRLRWYGHVERSNGARQPLTYRLMESVCLGGQRWHGSIWQWVIAENGSSRLSTLIDIPGDLVQDLPYRQQASTWNCCSKQPLTN